MIKQLLQTLCAASILAGCGGGGSSAESVTAPPAQAQPSTVTVTSSSQPATPTYTHSMPGNSGIKFKSDADVTVINPVAELELDYCTLSYVQHVITLDLNNDNEDDLLMFVLCGSPDVDFPSAELEHDAPLRNTMIAVLSQPDGSYKVDNKTLFGSDAVELGAELGGVAGFFTPLEDPNGGLPIISYIVSRDDFVRKYKSDFSNVTSYQGVFSPNWEGTYDHVELGETPFWAQGVVGLPNTQYSWDLLYGYWSADWRNHTPIAHRYDLVDGWVDVSDEYDADEVKYHMSTQPYLQALDSVNHSPFGETKLITTDFAVGGSGEGITLYALNSGFPSIFAEWNVYDNMEWYQWGSYDEPGCGRREIIVHNNMPYFGGLAWDHFEVWYPSPDSGPRLLAFAASLTLPAGQQYDPNREYTCDDEMVGATFMAMFDISSGRLEMVESPFPTDTIAGAGVLKQTVDINNDGYMDYFAANGWAHGQLPRVWLNDKNGKLVEVSTSSLPLIKPYSVCDNNSICLNLDSESVFADMNNDGIMDIVQWHVGTVVPDLHEYMYAQGVNPDAFKNKSGYIGIWYGIEQ